jgi:hypothetical protein
MIHLHDGYGWAWPVGWGKKHGQNELHWATGGQCVYVHMKKQNKKTKATRPEKGRGLHNNAAAAAAATKIKK